MENLISKKDLLETANISYGQLYRWKRKNLIPENWFIRKSTFTGQETFFPKEDILQRIEKIKSMKDDLSLDELADMFSPSPSVTSLSADELTKRNIVSTTSFEMYTNHLGTQLQYSFENLLSLYLLDRLLQTGEMNRSEGIDLLNVLHEHLSKLKSNEGELIFIRKMGVSLFILTLDPTNLFIDSQAKIIAQYKMNSCIEELKLKLS
ncbi:YhbD family protein [Fictibacillus barbaricus]|uniref:DNA-binding transcriptional MerR regulator n=1 Tax=Fictibacillus barbaricus TaxID=182136 RepID=A0ABU1TV56_9BACL|nr:YhbD family protein [Fictibacillus barbaricus]MDR7071100.1 DNA-binding transcriptional MerR regulator [Fictibacillus barbaricus]